MDDVDIFICKALIRDARAPYHAIAKQLGISTVAVHKRVQSLVGQGIIGAFRAEVDIRAVRGASVMVFGRSEAASTSQLCDTLAADDSTSMVILASGNFVYVGAMLRSISDLERYLEFVRSAGQMPKAVAGLHTTRPSGLRITDIPDPGAISPLEMRIIASLRDDARKRATEVSKELGITPRMVSSRLKSMVQDRKINMTISWRPDYSNDTVALSHLTLNMNASKLDAIDLLLGEYGRNVVFFSTFGNMPETILATVWAPSSKTISGIVDGLMSKGMFDRVVPNLICDGCFFDTWKEKMLDEVQLRPAKDR